MNIKIASRQPNLDYPEYCRRNPVQAEKAISLFSTSAVGYYGFHGDEELDEESPPGK